MKNSLVLYERNEKKILVILLPDDSRSAIYINICLFAERKK